MEKEGSLAGIQPFFEGIYLDSMLWHSRWAYDSIRFIDEWLSLAREKADRAFYISHIDVFANLQNILEQAARLSRYFFPASKKEICQSRGVVLRAAFSIGDDNLLKDRKIRNSLEHFDERLDQYLSANVYGDLVPFEIEDEPIITDTPRHVFKGFYINKAMFYLMGESYEMLPLAQEILRIHSLLGRSVDHGRLPRPQKADIDEGKIT